MNVRTAIPGDAPVLARIHVDSWQVAYRGIVSDSFLAGFTYERREASFRKALAAGLEETYLVDDDREPLGFLTVGPCRDADVDARVTGEIWGIYLAPSCWRRGIGRFLCGHAESLLRQRGCCEAVLWVLAANEPARRFYEALGFQQDGLTKTVQLGTPMEIVRYRKPL